MAATHTAKPSACRLNTAHPAVAIFYFPEEKAKPGHPADRMPIPLSKRCQKVAELLFSGLRLSRITERLIAEASENIPFHENSDPHEMDRVRFSIMKLASKSESGDDWIFDLARTDWRDLFMVAGFGYSTDAHNNWCRTLVPEENDDAGPA